MLVSASPSMDTRPTNASRPKRTEVLGMRPRESSKAAKTSSSATMLSGSPRTSGPAAYRQTWLESA
jgi:hypothetical protein